ncbi:hypothetical protein AYI70_g7786 [Smittium culicis]|uniref:Uncharacterized protein n=1 Tax=Smittium culicis TaxID=133412 RepID=A0A1R1XIX0_9FUNG|nr:hypothetical protein AYI70_g7786 [Smittium culicis]
MSEPILAKENLAVPIANKLDTQKITHKPVLVADAKIKIEAAKKKKAQPDTDRKVAFPTENPKVKKHTASGVKNISLLVIDVDIAGKSEIANSSDMDIDPSDVEVKIEPNFSQDGYYTQNSDYTEYNKVYDDSRTDSIDKIALEAYNTSRFGPPLLLIYPGIRYQGNRRIALNYNFN